MKDFTDQEEARIQEAVQKAAEEREAREREERSQYEIQARIKDEERNRPGYRY